MSKLGSLWLSLTLLLILWGSRVASLEVLPLHNDEGLHLTRAVEVWNLHPFWQISDGKIINHWPIAAFYPQNAPVFTGRLPTIMVSMIGLAAGYTLIRALFGVTPAVLAGVMWITSPYLFFFERLAFSDSQAGALVVLTLWAALRAARSGQMRDVTLTGVALGLAMLFKFTAAPFVVMVVMILLFLSRTTLQKRLLHVVMIGAVVAACFAVPLLYLALRGDDFFGIALGWIGTGSRGRPAFLTNVARLWEQLTGFGSLLWVILMLAGLAVFPFAPSLTQRRNKGQGGNGRARLRQARPYKGPILLIAGALPFLLMLILGREVLARHYVVALPLALIFAGAGLGLLINLLKLERVRTVLVALVSAALALSVAPFMLQAYADPGHAPLPEGVRTQHISEHSAGYGLREAMRALPDVMSRRDLPVIASMFPDGCKRANFYAVDGLMLTCTAVPGAAEIDAALSAYGAVYVLTDEAPTLGIDVNTVEDVKITRVAVYPRPDETEENASVALWLLER